MQDFTIILKKRKSKKTLLTKSFLFSFFIHAPWNISMFEILYISFFLFPFSSFIHALSFLRLISSHYTLTFPCLCMLFICYFYRTSFRLVSRSCYWYLYTWFLIIGILEYFYILCNNCNYVVLNICILAFDTIPPWVNT